jgi:nucleotide-binding universal stress UspA family protein
MSAAKYGIALAKIYRCRLVAVYVVDTATLKELLLSKIFVEDESAEYEQSLEATGRHYLDYVSELAKKKGVAAETVLRRGSISTEIIRAAEEFDADMIILGGVTDAGTIRDVATRQRREIMKNARCSILVVKEPDIDTLYSRL